MGNGEIAGTPQTSGERRHECPFRHRRRASSRARRARQKPTKTSKNPKIGKLGKKRCLCSTGRRASINWFLFYGLPPLGAVNGRNGLNSSLRVQIGRHVTPDHKQKLTAFRQNLLAQKSHGCTRHFQGTRTPLPRPTLRRNGMPRRWAPGGQRRAKAGRAGQKAVEDCTCLIDGLYAVSMSRSRSMSR